MSIDLSAIVREFRSSDVLSDIDLSQFFKTRISGVEVTQAIQYYHASQHLSDPSDRQPDNAVTLVARKPAWVRVYVRSGWRRGDVPGVAATIEVRRRFLGFRYYRVATLTAQPPGSVVAQSAPAYASERGNLNSSLNFIIPADMMCGHLRLIVTLTTPSGEQDTEQIDLNATLLQTLRLRGIMVAYNGPASTAAGAPTLNIGAPTVSDLQSTSAWALRTFPVESTAGYSSGGTITLTVPLSDPPSCPGCCTPNWVALNAQVAAQVTADGNQTNVLYYGLLPVGVPMGPIVGCESSGVSAGGVNNGVTLAHELGHHCGFPHAPCGGVGTPDASYPAYEPYDPANTPQASIGEYGLDITNGTVMSPATFKDMMSYCGPKWISLHNHGKLLNNTRLDPRFVCVDHPWWPDLVIHDPTLIPEKWLPDPPPDPYHRTVDPEPLISIIGVLESERQLRITSVMRVETRRKFEGHTTALTAELRGAKGEVIAAAPVRELRSIAHHDDGCGCGGGEPKEPVYPTVVQALIPDTEVGGELAVRRGDEDLWRQSRPDREPHIGRFEAHVEKHGLILSWEAEAADEPEIWVQWSDDDGGTWSALATGLRNGKAELDASHLPPGEVLLRLLAGDGFHTAVSDPIHVELPDRPPSIAILSPLDGQTLVPGAVMRLWGAVAHARKPVSEEPAARWLLDGEPVADGIDAYVETPQPGKHRLELLVAADPFDATATIEFNVTDIDRRELALEE